MEMSPNEMKLPPLDDERFVTEKIWRKEWVIDHIFLQRIKPEALIEMGKLRFQFLADVARMDGSLKVKEAEMFEKMGRLKY
jgi:hypothetical protein